MTDRPQMMGDDELAEMYKLLYEQTSRDLQDQLHIAKRMVMVGICGGIGVGLVAGGTLEAWLPNTGVDVIVSVMFLGGMWWLTRTEKRRR